MHKEIIILFFLSMMIFKNLQSQSNEGREFWFGFMEHFDEGENTKVAMVTSKRNAIGEISVPLMNWSQSFSILANQVTLIELPVFTEHRNSEKIENLGIRITTDQLSSVYIHQYHSMRSEATVVLPKQALDKSYYVMSYRGVRFNGQDYPSEILLVGVEDETSIQIHLSDATEKGKLAGSTIGVLLNKGQSYQVQAMNAVNDFTGTFIQSDKKLAVFGGNQWTEVPNGCSARDNLLEQMFPITTWGSTYISVPNAEADFDIFRILAAEDNTEISITTNTNLKLNLNAGEFHEMRLSQPGLFESNRPIIVAQFNVGSACSGHNLGDPSMVLLNSIEQIRDTVTIFNSRFQFIEENYINIITKSEDTEGLLFDGLPLVDQGVIFQEIGSDKEFSFARLKVNEGAHTLISLGCGLIANAYGYGNVESYAYGGGASFSKINENPIPEGACLDETITFRTDLSPKRFSFQWILENEVISAKTEFSRSFNELGFYEMSLIIEDHCLNTIDTVDRDFLVSLRQAAQVDDDVIVCELEQIKLEAIDVEGARYVWRGPLEYYSEEQNPKIQHAKLAHSGRYEVIGVVSGCATFPAYAEVIVNANPKPNLGIDVPICPIKEESITLFPGEFTKYEWLDESNFPSLEVTEPGDYFVEVFNDLNCYASDTIHVIELCPTEIYIPNTFAPTGQDKNRWFGVYGHDVISMEIRVYDSWGNVVFKSDQPEERWDGIINGQMAVPGVYVWYLTYEGYAVDGTHIIEKLSGTVTLVR